jgi:hypothetical protein
MLKRKLIFLKKFIWYFLSLFKNNKLNIKYLYVLVLYVITINEQIKIGRGLEAAELRRRYAYGLKYKASPLPFKSKE